jgi:putative transposase
VKDLASQDIPVKAACSALGLARSSYYNLLLPARESTLGPSTPSTPSHRALSIEERNQIAELSNSSEFLNQSPTAVVATLLDRGIYICSARTLYRILSSADEIRERRAVARHTAYSKPELLASHPNQVWSWDITKLKSFEKWCYFYLYVILDIFSRYVVGYLVAPCESAELAKELIEESCRRQKIESNQLTIHSDRGSAMKSKTLAQLYTDLGISKSFGRPSVSDDNPFSESQFKTLKYSPYMPNRIGSLEEARLVAAEAITWYNEIHHHSGIAYHTPFNVHYGLDKKFENIRNMALREAYNRHPERFNKPPVTKQVPSGVWINKPKILDEVPSPGLTTDNTILKNDYFKNEQGIYLKKAVK